MATLYPTERELRLIQRHADKGDKDAKNYIKLLEVCTSVLETSNGITQARGLMGEREDVYGHAVDDALAELVPVILDVAAGGWDSLQFYARPDQILGSGKSAEGKGK